MSGGARTAAARELAAQHLARGATYVAAAEMLGVSERTVRRWRDDDPVFRSRIDELQAEIRDQANGVLRAGATGGVAELVRLMKSRDENMRFRAAAKLVEFGLRAGLIGPASDDESAMGDLDRYLEGMIRPPAHPES
jgi:hypothetical protein